MGLYIGTSNNTIKKLSPVVKMPERDWQPNEYWMNIRKILEEDTHLDFPNVSKVIMLLDTSSIANQFTLKLIDGLVAVKTSDGKLYEGFPTGYVGESWTYTHTWDESKDYNTLNQLGYNQRWIILYVRANNRVNRTWDRDMWGLSPLYIIVKGVLGIYNNTQRDLLNQIDTNNQLKAIESFDDSSSIVSMGTIESDDTTNTFTNIIQEGLSNLEFVDHRIIGNPITTQLIGIFNKQVGLLRCQYDYVNTITLATHLLDDAWGRIALLDLSNFTNLNDVSNLINVGVVVNKLVLDNTDGTNFDNSGIGNVNTIIGINLLNAQNVNTTWLDGHIRHLTIKEDTINTSINFSGATQLTRTSLLNIIRNLVDLTGQPSLTINLGSENISKLTVEELNIITTKNWTYS